MAERGVEVDASCIWRWVQDPHGVALRQCKYLNNVIERGHRMVKMRVWLAKGDVVGQAHFICELFGLST